VAVRDGVFGAGAGEDVGAGLSGEGSASVATFGFTGTEFTFESFFTDFVAVSTAGFVFA
jgi:hypothetical protein